MPLAFSRSSGWAGRQTARHWISWLLTAALELRLGWGWQGVGDEAGCLWCAYRTAAALGSLPAHPWLVGPCSAPGSLIGRHSLGKGQTGTGTDNQSGVSGDQEKGPLISLYKYHTFPLSWAAFYFCFLPTHFFFFQFVFTLIPLQFGVTEFTETIFANIVSSPMFLNQSSR